MANKYRKILTQREIKGLAHSFNDKSAIDFKFFDKLEDMMEYARLRKEWAYVFTYWEEIELDIEALRLLETKGNKNAKTKIKALKMEIKWATKRKGRI